MKKMPGTKMDTNFMLKVAIILLIINKAQGHSRRWYAEHFQRNMSDTIFYPSDYSDRDYNGNSPPYGPSRTFSNQGDQRKVIDYPSVRTRGNSMEPENKFVFPNHGVHHRKYEFTSAPACRGATFCENVSNYPTDYVDQMISKDEKYQNYENVDAEETIIQRIDVADTEPLCVSVEKVVYPKSAESVDKNWLFIVNNPNYTQGVRIETCSDEGSACKLIDGFAAGYTSSCRQKYIYRQLTAIRSDGSLGRESFRFAASCCCTVQLVDAPRMRLMDPSAFQPRKSTKN